MRLPWRRGERASSVGWLVVDELARRHGASWRGKFDGRLAERRLDGHRIAVLKPETYMNLSGRSVGAAARFFKVEPDAILVVHDEGDYVLADFEPHDDAERIVARAADAIETLDAEGLERAQTQFN